LDGMISRRLSSMVNDLKQKGYIDNISRITEFDQGCCIISIYPTSNGNAYFEWENEQYIKEDKFQAELLDVHKEQLEQLRKVNENLNSKLDTANQTLDFVLSSIGANFQRIEKQLLLENKQLAELQSIVSAKDKGKMKNFIKEHGIDSLALILQLFSFFTNTGQ